MKKYSKLMAVLLVVAMLLPGIAQAAPVAEQAIVTRVSGDSRVGTSIKVSEVAMKTATDAVLVGYNGEADALTGAIVAKSKNAPLFYVRASEVEAVKARLDDLGVANVHILGGTTVFTKELMNEFDAYNPKRIDGSDRYETAINAAEVAVGKKAETVFLAKGNGDLADALAIGAISAKNDTPLLLTHTKNLTDATKQALADMGVKNIEIIGGEKAVTVEVVKELEKLGYTVDRTAGENRQETSVKIAEKFNPEASELVIANGFDYADAVTAGYFAAIRNAVVLLVNTRTVDPTVKAYLETNQLDTTVLGGTTAVPAKVFDQVVEYVDGIAADEDTDTDELKVESVSAINKTTVQVTFNKAVDKAEAASFTIEGGRVISSTLSENKMVATLDVTGLAYDTEYTVVIKDVVVDGEAAAEMSAKFTTPAVAALWNLEVVPAAGSIEADGTDNTTITFQLVDKVTGEVDKNANDIVLDLNTTYGSLAQQRATIQNGVATVVLRSEFNAKGVTAKVEAQIIEASGDYTDLIGQVSGSANVVFAAPGSTEVEAVYLTAANTNEADRVTLTFDKKVSVADFVYTDPNTGKLTGNLRTDNKVSITQNGDVAGRTIKGFLPGPTSNSLIAVLDRTKVLTDNSDVKVVVEMKNSAGKVTESEQNFKFTDARVPQVTSVTAIGMNKLTVKFSEPIAKADFLIDGEYTGTRGFDVVYGELIFDRVSSSYVDNRNIVTITLNNDYKEVKNLDGYFKAGKHALQVSNIYDFAAETDKNNIGSTQNLEFNVADIKDIAVPTVIVDSPNQYRIAFDKEANIADDEIELQVYDTGSKKWNKAGAPTNGVVPSVTVKLISGDISNPYKEYKVEVTNDWTNIYNTAVTKDNYYNDQYRLVIKEGEMTTIVNGKTNAADINLPLNYKDSPMNGPDTTSPVIKSIEEGIVKGTYIVTMSEPVKKVNTELAKSVEFIGKDKDAKVQTFAGTAGEYTGEGLDTKFTVTATDFTDMEEIVKNGGSEDWTLVLRDVTDDIGNKAATVTKDFKITHKQIVSKFEVVNVEGSVDGKEAITVKFTQDVALTGKGSAIDTANFALNGKDLPVGTSISLVTNNTISINIAKDTLQVGSNVLTLGKNLESKDGKVLTGAYAFTFNVERVNRAEVGSLAQLLTLIESETLEAGDTIKLTADIDLKGTGLELTEAVNLDLNGKTLTGDVSIADAEYAEDITISAGTITGNLTVNTPKATVNNNATVTGDIIVTAVAENTWNQNVSHTGKIVWNATDARLVVAEGATVAKIEAKVNIKLENEGIITTLTVAKEATAAVAGNVPTAVDGEGTTTYGTVTVADAAELKAALAKTEVKEIKVVSNSAIELSEKTVLNRDVTIDGSHSLNFKGGISVAENAKVTIKQANIKSFEQDSINYGIFVNDGELTLEDSYVRVVGKGQATGIQLHHGEGNKAIVKDTLIQVTAGEEKSAHGIYAGANTILLSEGNTFDIVEGSIKLVYGTEKAEVGDALAKITSTKSTVEGEGVLAIRVMDTKSVTVEEIEEEAVTVFNKTLTDYIDGILKADAKLPKKAVYSGIVANEPEEEEATYKQVWVSYPIAE